MTGRGLGDDSEKRLPFDRACVICDKPEDYANQPENPFEQADDGHGKRLGFAHRNCRIKAKLALNQTLIGGTR